MTLAYMQFYPADYLADTMYLSLEEHGAYLKLLMCMWRADGWLPDDDKKICMMLGVTGKKWASIKESISSFFIYENGKFSQKRLLAEHRATRKKSENLSSNGKQGGRPKHMENNNSPKADGFNRLKQNESIARSPSDPEPESYSSDTNVSSPELLPISNEISSSSERTQSEKPKSAKPTKPKPEDFDPPDWIPRELWETHMDVRKSKAAVNTARAKKLLVNQLERLRAKGHDPALIIENSIRNSWKDYFEPKPERKFSTSWQSPPVPPPRKPRAQIGYDEQGNIIKFIIQDDGSRKLLHSEDGYA